MKSTKAFPVQHGIGLSIMLHLFPGLVLTMGFLVLAPVLVAMELPALLALILLDAFIVLPLMIVILWYAARKERRQGSEQPFIPYRHALPWHTLLLLSLVSLLWAVLVFALVAPSGDWLRTSIFHWVPAWFDLGHYLESPASYRQAAIIVTWWSGLFVTSLAAPVVEEIYFRGYLLPRIDRLGARAPMVNLVLFAVYHFWSIWYAPVRVLALIPMVYLIWFKRCIYIGIIVHVLLNLVGDHLLTLPVLFH